MAQKVSIDEMADAIMEGLEEYAELAADEVKKAVRKTDDCIKVVQVMDDILSDCFFSSTYNPIVGDDDWIFLSPGVSGLFPSYL